MGGVSEIWRLRSTKSTRGNGIGEMASGLVGCAVKGVTPPNIAGQRRLTIWFS